MTLSTRQEPVDPAWIDDERHLVVIDMRELGIIHEKTIQCLLDTLGTQLSKNRRESGIGSDRMLRLAIASTVTPERAWMKIADAYQRIFARGLEFKNELPPPYQLSV